jgi:hypothetical protein
MLEVVKEYGPELAGFGLFVLSELIAKSKLEANGVTDLVMSFLKWIKNGPKK